MRVNRLVVRARHNTAKLISICLFVSLIARLLLKLIKPMVFEQAQRFTIRDGRMTLGTGVVTKVLPTLTPDERMDLLAGKKAREKKAAGKVAAKK